MKAQSSKLKAQSLAFRLTLNTLIIVFILIARVTQANEQGFLITTNELANLDDPKVRIIDARDPKSYMKGHIKNAVNFYAIKLDSITANKEGYPIPQKDAEEIFGNAGIGKDTKVIVYDDQIGQLATRVWFVLRFFGHDKVKVLNGGFKSWVRDGYPVTKDKPNIEKTVFKANPDLSLIATSEYVKNNLGNNAIVILDTRTLKEYSGIQKTAAQAGHIPGAINLEFNRLNEGDKSFASNPILEKIFQENGVAKDKEAIVYCESGVRASHTFLALKMLGHKGRLYEGSWKEWGNNLSLPVEK